MTINLSIPQTDPQLQPRITVIGVGGAGGNAVNNMIESGLEGAEFVAANTDSQALSQTLAERRIQLGRNITHGLGAGSRPDIGRAAAEEAIDEIAEHLHAAHMVFITAGMGGGTGTGAAPVIARLAREQGILTVGVVTKPFQFEGVNRMRIAEAGIDEMQQYADTLIVIPNQNLFRVANEKTTFAEAFAMADEVLHSGVRGVTDLMVVPGLINLDFADIRTVMSEMGKAMMGTGEAEGENRARLAAEAAISNPLLDEVSMQGARGVLINITGGADMTLFEVDEAANRIGEEVDSDSNIIFGSTMDPAFDGKMRVSVVATGIDVEAGAQPRPVLKVYSRPVPAYGAADEAGARPADGEASPPPPAAECPAARPWTGLEPPRSASALPADAGGPGGVEAGPSGGPDPVLPAKPPAPSADSEAEEGDAVAEPPQPRVVDTPDVFIPPPPVDPRATAGPTAPPDPFKEADMINGAGKDRGQKPNLLQRMTGGARARRDSPVAAGAAAPATRPFAGAAAVDPAPEQVRLEGVDRRDPVTSARSEDDLLDIPAFLRRQAN